jgi:hypothetical protein
LVALPECAWLPPTRPHPEQVLGLVRVREELADGVAEPHEDGNPKIWSTRAIETTNFGVLFR